MLALYRVTSADDWIDVEVIDWRYRRYVVREVGKQLPGVALATIDQLRVPAEHNELRVSSGVTANREPAQGAA